MLVTEKRPENQGPLYKHCKEQKSPAPVQDSWVIIPPGYHHYRSGIIGCEALTIMLIITLVSGEG